MVLPIILRDDFHYSNTVSGYDWLSLNDAKHHLNFIATSWDSPKCSQASYRPQRLLSYGVWLIVPNKTPFQRANYEGLHGAVWSRIRLDEICSWAFWHQPSAECYVLNYTDPAWLLRMASLCFWHIICDNSGDLSFTLKPARTDPPNTPRPKWSSAEVGDQEERGYNIAALWYEWRL